jgi:hypothetical protein
MGKFVRRAVQDTSRQNLTLCALPAGNSENERACILQRPENPEGITRYEHNSLKGSRQLCALRKRKFWYMAENGHSGCSHPWKWPSMTYSFSSSTDQVSSFSTLHNVANAWQCMAGYGSHVAQKLETWTFTQLYIQNHNSNHGVLNAVKGRMLMPPQLIWESIAN